MEAAVRPADFPMRERLTRENLSGVWAAVTTPFDEHDRFDSGVLRENVRRLAAAGVHGAYVTDSDGEFYVIELDEFREIVDTFADEAQRVGLPTQVGATWSHTKGIVDRLRHAAERGILGAHVGHPTYMEMTPESLSQFWQDVSSAVPQTFGLIQYQSPRLPNPLSPAEYGRVRPAGGRGPQSDRLQAHQPRIHRLPQRSPDLSTPGALHAGRRADPVHDVRRAR
jgi:4-hydroxy-tetrahydrodipicolinate synthase